MIRDKSAKQDVVYILECSDGTYYTGWTNDIEKRLSAHNSQTGAKYTKNRLPAVLRYFEECEDRIVAMQREYAIKHLKRLEKEKLVDSIDNNKKRKIIRINNKIFNTNC